MSTSELSARLAALTKKEEAPMAVSRKTVGQSIASSEAWKAFVSGRTDRFSLTLKDDEPGAGAGGADAGAGDAAADTPVPAHADAASWVLGRTEAAAATWNTETLPGIQNEVLEAEQHIVDLMNVYNVSTPWVRYRRLTGYTRGAAVVAEKGQKPRASLTVGSGEATTYTIATGFDLTRQEIRDDSALVNLVDGLLRMDLREKVAALCLSGTGTNEPLGVLTDPDIQTYAAASGEDIMTSVRAARDKLRRVQGIGTPTLLVSVEDAFKIDTTQLTSNAYMYAGSPYGVGAVQTLWGIPVVVDGNLSEGTALLGRFKNFDLRMREGVTVTAFEQHADYAEHNMVYVRAELDCGTMHRLPKNAVKITFDS